MPNLSIGGKNTKLPQPIIVIRKKRKQTTDENIYIGPTGTTDEPTLKSRWKKIRRGNKEHKTNDTADEPAMIKISRRKKAHKDDGRSNKSTKTSTFPVLNEVTNHASPKIWDIFQRFQKFSQRRILTRTKSGLLESADEDENKENMSSSNTDAQPVPDVIIIENRKKRPSDSNTETTMPDDEGESLTSGDRKRRCVETIDYDDELQATVKVEAQPANAFKPKCLNFDDID